MIYDSSAPLKKKLPLSHIDNQFTNDLCYLSKDLIVPDFVFTINIDLIDFNIDFKKKLKLNIKFTNFIEKFKKIF